jgi:hypothetical protein
MTVTARSCDLATRCESVWHRIYTEPSEQWHTAWLAAKEPLSCGFLCLLLDIYVLLAARAVKWQYCIQL